MAELSEEEKQAKKARKVTAADKQHAAVTGAIAPELFENNVAVVDSCITGKQHAEGE